METRELIHECKYNNAAAQELLYAVYACQMFKYCRCFFDTKAEAEEAMNDGFLRMFKEIKKFTYINDAGVTAWIKMIMRNICLQHKDRQKLVPKAAADLPENMSVEAFVNAKLETDEITRLINAIPKGYGRVFRLFAIEGYSHREIAAMMNISENTSKSQYSRARSLLQELIISNNNYHEGRI